MVNVSGVVSSKVYQEQESPSGNRVLDGDFEVGATGFKPATPCSQIRFSEHSYSI